MIRGTILEMEVDTRVRLRSGDGSVFVFDWDEIERIERSEAVLSHRNPYSTRKMIGGVGFVATYAGSVAGALAMDDDFIGTTAIPVVGPFVTVARIESDRRATYRPGGKGLLIASGVLQTGFLTYYVVNWSKGRSHRSRVALRPEPAGLALEYRF